ncbi:MAG: DUF2085 domain-containing protein [Bacteroidetes bacterium]|nr:DUF2085 domain-containing protein [Rhodothermia bacterium]MCS7155270.1 DUF2085 domain-containing protein [Bacteroidota bacterium]MCX7907855.1 DUF2085 domain-containing protein [Bacteroidota bacterium]MDW8138674.1 DUF2085 domain-containing protein [Bacteroidota bacterium]MDW8284740.1 DUF2085 domain-containing protein [Bacteroidota bacterium]
MRCRLAYGLLWTALGGLLLGAVLPAWLHPDPWEAWQSPWFRLYGGLCHQLPERSFWGPSAPMAVCQRCMGLLGGLFVGSLLAPLGQAQRARWARRGSLLLAGALLLVALDWLWGWLYGNSALSRVLTGACLGLVCGPYAAWGWVALWRPGTGTYSKRERCTHGNPHYPST